ncbi:MAG: non-homologous end-joining DNA ligase [Candidatus Eremiobacteraeota bacterium]|nr:non-homologous end-joining DNA ligase [Candidatus Eremiobacteraeota bacterium]
MLATLIAGPFDDDAWSFETKWDGVRALCAIRPENISLTSRTGHDLLGQYPELAVLRRAFRRLPVLVDGEICSLDGRGRSSFQRLQNHTGRIALVVFDCLAAGGLDLRKHPLRERQKILAQLVRTSPRILLSTPTIGCGKRLFEIARKRGWEGIVGKRLDSAYQERRSRDWVKIKVVFEQEAAIIGWTDPKGSRADFGALLLGIYDRGKLQFVGKVGTGFNRQTLEDVIRRLRPLELKVPSFPKPSGANVHWARPRLVAEIKFAEWTRDGSMRQPVFLGLRFDKKPQDCVRALPRR